MSKGINFWVKFRDGKLTPEQFREAVGGGKSEFLGTLVDRYNECVTKKEDKAEVGFDKI